MKTIQIDKEDEAPLIEILSQNGFEKYAERIKKGLGIVYQSPPEAAKYLSPGLNISKDREVIASESSFGGYVNPFERKMNGVDKNNW